ncbi:MAG: redox-sensing transcriptional repressor Rex [Anaerolineae bacterium]|nr:redox-sensing transcriptional repressor Rex [Anaerolineae bacterium]
MPKTNVPDVVIRRLPLYLRCLTYMAERGHKVVSSAELAKWVGVSSAQIRKDLSFFGEFGKQGWGYEVSYLRDQLQRILQADRDWFIALVGAGALGHALINYRTFERWHFHIAAVFDNDPQKVGTPLGHLLVQPMEEMRHTIQERNIQIGILAIPAEHAQQVAEQLVECGVRAILNYAPINLSLPPGIRVAHIDPVSSLQSMTFYL